MRHRDLLASGVVVATILLTACDRPYSVVDNPVSALQTWEVGSGRQPLVLLHGYGSSPAEWLPFTSTVRPAAGQRFVFPKGPEAGPGGHGRGWWRLDLASHLDSTGLPDMSRMRPAGLALASRRVSTLLTEVNGRLDSPPNLLVLGGFSQGAMVSAEIAFRSATPLQGLILLSPTVIDSDSWRQGIRARRGLPVFIAHGRADTVLPFAASERFADTLRHAGLGVTWVPFDGGHDISEQVIAALNTFLSSIEPATAPAVPRPAGP